MENSQLLQNQYSICNIKEYIDRIIKQDNVDLVTTKLFDLAVHVEGYTEKREFVDNYLATIIHQNLQNKQVKEEMQKLYVSIIRLKKFKFKLPKSFDAAEHFNIMQYISLNNPDVQQTPNSPQKHI